MASISGWFPIGKTPQLLVCRSRVYELVEHYLDGAGHSVRCAAESCVFCELYPPRRNWVVAVSRPSSARVQLLRLTASVEEVARQLGQQGELLVGQVVEVCMIGNAKGEGMELRIGGLEAVKPVPCARYIAALGKRRYDEAVEAWRTKPKLLEA